MTTDLDIYCFANILMKRHGVEVSILAAMYADAIL